MIEFYERVVYLWEGLVHNIDILLLLTVKIASMWAVLTFPVVLVYWLYKAIKSRTKQ
jgi:hypothetical protein